MTPCRLLVALYARGDGSSICICVICLTRKKSCNGPSNRCTSRRAAAAIAVHSQVQCDGLDVAQPAYVSNGRCPTAEQVCCPMQHWSFDPAAVPRHSSLHLSTPRACGPHRAHARFSLMPCMQVQACSPQCRRQAAGASSFCGAHAAPPQHGCCACAAAAASRAHHPGHRASG